MVDRCGASCRERATAGGGLNRASEIDYVGFSQDGSCIVVAGKQGFAVLDVDSGERIHVESAEACGPVGLVEVLFRTSLLALVGGTSSTSGDLTMWNAKGRCAICSIRFASEICAVRLNFRRVVVLLRAKIHLFDLKTMKALLVIDRVAVPSPAVAALCADPERGYLATPLVVPPRQELLCSQENDGVGFIAVTDTHTLRAVGTVLAHRSEIQAVCFNSTGELLATASVKGTVIRVFGTPSLSMLYTFRRGMNPCRIFNLAFAVDSWHLTAAAASGTVHIFKLPSIPIAAQRQQQEASSVVSTPRSTGGLRLGPLPACCGEGAAMEAAALKIAEEVEGSGPEVKDMDELLSEWHVVMSESSDAVATHSSPTSARTLLWRVVQPWQELADSPCAAAWLRLGLTPVGENVEHGSLSPLMNYTAHIVPPSRSGLFSDSGGKAAVISEDGSFRLFGWNPSTGGEGRLLMRRALADHLVQGTPRREDASTGALPMPEVLNVARLKCPLGESELDPSPVDSECDQGSEDCSRVNEIEQLRELEDVGADGDPCAGDFKTITSNRGRRHRQGHGRGRVK